MSPGKLELPTTWPRLFISCPSDKSLAVPPSPPKSFMLPFSHKNGSSVGKPVVEFGIELVYENPVICPLPLTTNGMASGPPKLPKSCMPSDSVQQNACVCVPQPLSENGSGIVSPANPTTTSRLFMHVAALSLPPFSVPRSKIWPFL